MHVNKLYGEDIDDSSKRVPMEEEYVDIYDNTMNLLGSIKRSVAHSSGAIHRTFHCWFVDSDYIYFQIRGSNVGFPNFLDATVGGHIRSGESVEDTSREIVEEIGIELSFSDLSYAGRRLLEYRGGDHHIREMAEVFFTTAPNGIAEFKPNPDELYGIAGVPYDAYESLFKMRKDSITVQALVNKDQERIIDDVSVSLGSFIEDDLDYISSVFVAARRFFQDHTNYRI